MAKEKKVTFKIGDHVKPRNTAEVDPDPVLTRFFPGSHPSRHNQVYLVEDVRRYQEEPYHLLLLVSLDGYDRFWLNENECIRVILR